MQQVTANVYVETGTFGCNPSFVTTTEGIVMIDTPYLPGNAVKWRDEIAKRGEVRYIINTEHHVDHTFELTHLPGHTSNEVGVYIPQERVFCTGDNFVHKYQPAMTQCCPLEWIESLEKIEATDADVFVPGHGEVGDRKAVREFREFIAECVDTVRKAMDQGSSAEEAAERISFETEAYPPALHPGPDWQRINVRRIYEMLSK